MRQRIITTPTSFTLEHCLFFLKRSHSTSPETEQDNCPWWQRGRFNTSLSPPLLPDKRGQNLFRHPAIKLHGTIFASSNTIG